MSSLNCPLQFHWPVLQGPVEHLATHPEWSDHGLLLGRGQYYGLAPYTVHVSIHDISGI